MSEIKISKEVSEIKESIKKLNLGQVSELIEGLKTDYNIQETAVVQTAAAQSEEKIEEKDSRVSVKFVKIKEGLSAIKGYGAIREEHDKLAKEKLVEGEIKNILEVRRLTTEGDKIIFKGIPRNRAEEIKQKLAQEGVEVEIVKVEVK